ncbi:MAG: DUF460 domain-containing protein [Candidatus Micrarchaeia archaeon]
MHIIVGIDVGKTEAVACISLNKQLLYVGHKDSINFEWLVSQIRNVGTPSIIAYDRSKTTEIVRKVAASFNARIFIPDSNLSIEEKRTIANKVGIKNPHERDAYASAIKAYNSIANKLNQSDHMAKVYNKNSDYVKAMVIRKYSMKEALFRGFSGRR